MARPYFDGGHRGKGAGKALLPGRTWPHPSSPQGTTLNELLAAADAEDGTQGRAGRVLGPRRASSRRAERFDNASTCHLGGPGDGNLRALGSLYERPPGDGASRARSGDLLLAEREQMLRIAAVCRRRRFELPDSEQLLAAVAISRFHIASMRGWRHVGTGTFRLSRVAGEGVARVARGAFRDPADRLRVRASLAPSRRVMTLPDDQVSTDRESAGRPLPGERGPGRPSSGKFL